MTPQVSLAFSLPSSLKEGQGFFVDPRSLCTSFILNKLRDLQATVVEALLPAAAAAGVGAATAAVVAVNDAAAAASGAAAAPDGDASVTVPAGFHRPREQIIAAFTAPLTTLLTPPAIVRRRLLNYNRATHLMPAVSAFAKQTLAYGEGNLTGFDFAHIERDLMDTLVPHLCPFEVTVREYQFQGEMGTNNSMLRLGSRIKQKPLPNTVLDQIWIEVDIDHRRALLTSQLEDCVTFLASSSSAGGAELDGETKLESYLLNTLLLDEKKWAEMKCPTLCSQVKLCHLKALLDGLEERRNGGDPLANLPQRFRTGTLSAAHAAALRRVCDHASAEEAQELIGTMRSCLLDQFVPAGESGGMHSDSLYLYLEWAGFDAACFADFPQDMKTSHAYECFHFLQKALRF